MDILFKIRLAVWLMVLTLWGTMVYQFLGGGEHFDHAPRMQWVSNPFPKRTPPGPSSSSALAQRQGSLSKIMVPPTPPPARLPGMEGHRTKIQLPQREYPPREPAPTPAGFYKSATRHFFVFSEGEPASQNLLKTIEMLHSNLMLDLAAFSPWARDEPASIFLFRSQENYRRVTGRPPWSGGASSISKRKIYLYGSDEQIGILAHELCHIYFDSFFNEGHPDPLWLSEGIATLMQIERGLSSPNWLPENLNILYQGGGYRLSDLMNVESTIDAEDAQVRLWYTQAYSVVRFLIRSRWKSSFYRFCVHLREGKSINEALLAAYGMPFNRVQALEYAWRYDLQTHRISGLTNQR